VSAVLETTGPYRRLLAEPVLRGLASSAAPGGEGTEAQAWLNSVMNGGAAAGAALAAATASRPLLALALAAVTAAAAAASSAYTGLR
jgi:hypothetical protein